MTQNVVAGTTIELEIARTTPLDNFIGANFTITEPSVVPEPGSLVLCGISASLLTVTAMIRRRRK